MGESSRGGLAHQKPVIVTGRENEGKCRASLTSGTGVSSAPYLSFVLESQGPATAGGGRWTTWLQAPGKQKCFSDQGPAPRATHLRGLARCRHTGEEPGDTWSLAKGWHRGRAGQVVQLLSLPRQRSFFTSMTPSSGKNLKCPSGRGAMDFRECLTFPFYGQGH